MRPARCRRVKPIDMQAQIKRELMNGQSLKLFMNIDEVVFCWPIQCLGAVLLPGDER